MPRNRTGARSRVRKLVLAGITVAVTASVATVTGVSMAAVTPNNTAVTPLSRGSGAVDLVWVGDQGRIHFASQAPGSDDWFTGFLNRGVAAPNTKVTGVSRHPGRLDLFAVGTDHKVYTAFLDEGMDRPGTVIWHGWFPLGGNVHDDSSVHVASLNRDTMDIFTLDTQNRPVTMRWTAQDGWGAWQRVDASGEDFHAATNGAEVTAVAFNGEIHLFTSKRRVISGPTYTDPPITKRLTTTHGWSAWEELRGQDLAFGSELAPVVSGGSVFVMAATRVSPNVNPDAIRVARFNGREWAKPMTKVLDGVPERDTSVHVVARSAGLLDAFAVGTDSQVYTAAWNSTDGWGGWWPLGGEAGGKTSVT
ncbi:MAG TPA: hypothetical protein VFT95_02250, partial [Micromonosporaceae bacterium]|nr:hypothetical protein [Micromonosporaceae bacterium]